jgi:hypothetical protein
MAQQGDPTTPISKKIFPLFLLDPLLTHKKKRKKKKKKKKSKYPAYQQGLPSQCKKVHQRETR